MIRHGRGGATGGAPTADAQTGARLGSLLRGIGAVVVVVAAVVSGALGAGGAVLRVGGTSGGNRSSVVDVFGSGVGAAVVAAVVVAAEVGSEVGSEVDVDGSVV